ncbi:AraC family transcriptional regulator [Couchioplanes caeruleus]|uniref:helix-turn-helix domain-containing protein n=1 Tax=Couchioplanes caeruleus TaxID=56438 RepID=UPI0020BD79BA|nr:AraC family transcriptional regulator [Couchioplanes caeruleus]UQU63895.1 AraC family transcriptional regulator [Couchioplanes caeruleus]
MDVSGRLPSRLAAASDSLGWCYVRAARYADPTETEPFLTRSDKLLVVLVTSGRYRIESRRGASWRAASYRPGSVGITAPGNASVLRWRAASSEPMESLHLHLDPAAAAGTAFPDALTLHDAYVVVSARVLSEALSVQAPALYADSVAQGLTVHLAHRFGKPVRQPTPAGALSEREVGRVVEYMRAHLGDDVSLEALAGVARVSKFHFLRAFAAATGVTPYRYLRRLRLQVAAGMLRRTGDPVARIALLCGYRSSGQFARAFRAEYGVPPRLFRG